MEIQWNCAGCGLQLALDSQYAGREAECPKCKKPLIIPSMKVPEQENGPQPPAAVLSREAHTVKPAAPQTPPLAIWSLVMGILGFVLGLIAAIPAIICGHKALGKFQHSSEPRTGKGMAIAGLVCGYVSLPLACIISLAFLGTLFDSITGPDELDETPTTGRRRSEVSRQPATPRAREYRVEVAREDVVSDVPLKTQIERDLLVAPDITKGALRNALLAHYNELKQKTGFKHHNPPTHIFIVAYPSEEYLAAGRMSSIGSLLVIKRGKPQISIKDSYFDSRGKQVEMTSALAEKTRKQIWRELAGAEDKALTLAERKHPGWDMETIQKRVPYMEAMEKKFRGQICRRHGVTDKQLDSIMSEGIQKLWPQPDIGETADLFRE